MRQPEPHQIGRIRFSAPDMLFASHLKMRKLVISLQIRRIIYYFCYLILIPTCKINQYVIATKIPKLKLINICFTDIPNKVNLI